MAISITGIATEGARGRIIFDCSSSDIMLSQVFTGTPQFYPGSTVEIQELLQINSILYDESLIGTSLGWALPQKRLGTYQLFSDILASSPIREGEYGYLSSQIFEISRISRYTITAAPDVIFGKHEQIALDNCNAYLTPEIYIFPGDPTPDAGFRYYDLNPLFLGSTTISKAPLRDTPFNQKVKSVGLFFAPGVEGQAYNYKISVINDIYADYDPVVPPTCEFLGSSCDAQFAAFLGGNIGYFDSIASAMAAFPDLMPSQIIQDTYICTTDPTYIRDYYFANVGPL